MVCPSLYDFGPHIVTEALLNDLPVVAFNQGIAQDTVFEGKNGFLVNNFDLKKYADSIYKILFNKKKIIGIPSLKQMKRNCSSDYETNKIIKISHDDLIKSKRLECS